MTDTQAPQDSITDPDSRDEPAVVRTVDAALLLYAAAAVTLWMALTDGMLRYLRPQMRTWLTLSGLFLAVIATLVLITAWLDDRRARQGDGSTERPSHDDGCGEHAGHRHRLGYVGWLLALPLVVAVAVDPSALGAYAIRQQSSLGSFAPGDFDLADHIQSHSFAGQAVDLQLHEFLSASYDEDQADLLADTEVRLNGFVVAHPDDPSRFLIARMIIGCCAGDAVGLTVEVDGWAGAIPPDETWISVTGHLDPVATASSPVDEFTGDRMPVLQATDLHEIDAPDQPYEYPR